MKEIHGQLPCNEQYRLEGISYVGTEGSTTCDNCGHIITNIAEVTDVHSGKAFYIGTECLDTILTYRQNSGFELMQFMKEFNKQKKIASMIKNGTVLIEKEVAYFYKNKGVTVCSRDWSWRMGLDRLEYYKAGINIKRSDIKTLNN